MRYGRLRDRLDLSALRTADAAPCQASQVARSAGIDTVGSRHCADKHLHRLQDRQVVAAAPLQGVAIPVAAVSKVGGAALETIGTVIESLVKMLVLVLVGAIRLAGVLLIAAAALVGIGIAIALSIAFPPVAIVLLVSYSCSPISESLSSDEAHECLRPGINVAGRNARRLAAVTP